MAGDFATELESVARELRRQADGALFRELTSAFRDAVRPVPAKIRAGLRPEMPDRYADTLDADLNLRTSVRTAGSEPGVSLIATTRSGKNRKLARLDAGDLTHPLFGDRDHRWYTQAVTPGWFTGPCEAAGPQVYAALEAALERVAAAADRAAAAGT